MFKYKEEKVLFTGFFLVVVMLLFFIHLLVFWSLGYLSQQALIIDLSVILWSIVMLLMILQPESYDVDEILDDIDFKYDNEKDKYYLSFYLKQTDQHRRMFRVPDYEIANEKIYYEDEYKALIFNAEFDSVRYVLTIVLDENNKTIKNSGLKIVSNTTGHVKKITGEPEEVIVDLYLFLRHEIKIRTKTMN